MFENWVFFRIQKQHHQQELAILGQSGADDIVLVREGAGGQTLVSEGGQITVVREGAEDGGGHITLNISSHMGGREGQEQTR